MSQIIDPPDDSNVTALPVALQDYLSPSLWMQLQAEPTRRGLLLDALSTLHSQAYLLSTYLPRPLVEALKREPIPGRVAGERCEGTLLFADVSGFTALSERLADQGPAGVETLTGHINAYFDTMVQILARSAGVVLKFAGDALLAYFPHQEGGQHALWATRAAQRMMRAMVAFAAMETPAGPVALRMKIGLATGPFIAAAVGSPERMEYVVFGATVARTLAIEGTLSAGQIGGDAPTAAFLPPERTCPHTGDFFTLTPGEDNTDFEVGPESQRRARESGLLMASHTELRAHIGIGLRQIQALSTFLPASLVEAFLAYAQQRQLPAENRPAAVLFFNLTGVESLWNPEDPKTLSHVISIWNACFGVLQKSIARYGGIISRIDPYKTGSKILALFGAPIAHEDDPLRAVRAALDAWTGFEALRARWERESLPVEGLALRAGIAYGPTFAGPVGAAIRREYTVMGDDINLAARLMGAAQSGQLLVAASVASVTQSAVELTVLPPLQLKGKREPVSVYQVEGLRRDPLSHRLALRGPLFGRAAELETARTSLRQALSGQGGLLSVIGEPGMGKSHFADTLIVEARAAGASAHLVTCAAYAAAIPYAPWIDLIRHLSGLAPDTAREDGARLFLQWLAQEHCATEDIAGPLLQLLDLPGGPALATLRRPLSSASPRAGLFQRLGEQAAPALKPSAGPSLWQLARERQYTGGNGDTWRRLERRIAERVQTRLFAAVEHVLAALAEVSPRILIFEDAQWLDEPSRRLLTHLAAALARSSILFLVLSRPTAESLAFPGETITLEALGSEAAEELTTWLLETAVAPDELPALTQTIVARTGGNPLFVEELCAWVRRSGRHELESGLRSSLTLQDLILSRLDALPHAERETARAASIVGAAFETSELAVLLKGGATSQLLSALDGLERARFVFSAEVHDHHAFCQTLVRELLYDAQPLARRRKLHARLAEFLQANHAADLVPVAEALSHHYFHAAIWIEAARYALFSGCKAQRRTAHEQALIYYTVAGTALAHLSVAESVTPEVRALRGRIRAGEGDVALLQGHFAEAARAYTEAHCDLPEFAPLLIRLALVQPLSEGGGTALEMAQVAWTLVESTAESLSSTAALLAWLHWRSNTDSALAWAERSNSRALIAWVSDDFRSAFASFQAEEETIGAALAALHLSAAATLQDELTEAQSWLMRAVELWTREGDAWGLALARCRQARLCEQLGDIPGAARAHEEALSLLRLVPAVAEMPSSTRAVDACQQQRYEDVFYALYIFNLLTPLFPEVQ